MVGSNNLSNWDVKYLCRGDDVVVRESNARDVIQYKYIRVHVISKKNEKRHLEMSENFSRGGKPTEEESILLQYFLVKIRKRAVSL